MWSVGLLLDLRRVLSALSRLLELVTVSASQHPEPDTHLQKIMRRKLRLESAQYASRRCTGGCVRREVTFERCPGLLGCRLSGNASDSVR